MIELSGSMGVRDNGKPLAVDTAGGDMHESKDSILARVGDVYLVHDDVLAPLEFLDAEQLNRLHQEDAESWMERTGGLYTAVVFDKVRRKLRIVQGPYSAPIHIYYCIHEDCLFFSTSYKALLSASGIERTWNLEARNTFLNHGFIPSSATLLEGVHKLTPGMFLEVDQHTGVVTSRTARREPRRKGTLTAASLYHDALSNVLESEISRTDGIGLTLSAGFDSNLVLHLLTQLTRKNMHAFTVGGKGGWDETQVAATISSSYDSVTHNTAMVTESTLQKLPDIVWRLEGAVYERGIFLQYELARLVEKSDIRAVMFSECADQILSRRFKPANGQLPSRIAFSRFPYEVGLGLVIKKNGILSNSFSIRGIYPYLNQNIVDLGADMAVLNRTKKRLHKLLAIAKLKKTVAFKLAARAGSTRLAALFPARGNLTELERRIDSTEFSCLMRDPSTHSKRESSERRMNACLHALYLLLFDRLILSGRYDDGFGQAGLETELGALDFVA